MREKIDLRFFSTLPLACGLGSLCYPEVLNSDRDREGRECANSRGCPAAAAMMPFDLQEEEYRRDDFFCESEGDGWQKYVKALKYGPIRLSAFQCSIWKAAEFLRMYDLRNIAFAFYFDQILRCFSFKGIFRWN